jgi:integrase
MKRSKAHIVPLSDEALAVLGKADALRMSESDVVFPGVAGKPMSDMTLLKVLRDMSEPYHVHGFPLLRSRIGQQMRASPMPW